MPRWKKPIMMRRSFSQLWSNQSSLPRSSRTAAIFSISSGCSAKCGLIKDPTPFFEPPVQAYSRHLSNLVDEI